MLICHITHEEVAIHATRAPCRDTLPSIVHIADILPIMIGSIPNMCSGHATHVRWTTFHIQ